MFTYLRRRVLRSVLMLALSLMLMTVLMSAVVPNTLTLGIHVSSFLSLTPTSHRAPHKGAISDQAIERRREEPVELKTLVSQKHQEEDLHLPLPKYRKDLCKQKEPDDVIHVVTSGDNGTFAPMVTLAASVLLNTQSPVMFHFITFDTQADSLHSVLQSSILKNSSYNIIPFSKDRLKGQFVVRAPRKELANPLNFARFFLPDILPCVKHLAYIDVDCLVLGDVKELIATPIASKHVIAGLPEYHKPAHMVLNFSNPYARRSGIKRRSIVMSAGVFVANMTRWVQQDITRLLQYWMTLNVRSPVVQFSGNGAGSQAIMLLAMHDKYSPLDKSWNTLYEFQQAKSVVKHPNLLHWNGPGKPWKSDKVKNARLWKYYFRRSQADVKLL